MAIRPTRLARIADSRRLLHTMRSPFITSSIHVSEHRGW
jgi:hypothetical protein